MRLKSIINVSTSVTESDGTLIVSDLTGPTKIIPVADSSAYSAGDIVLLKWDFTDGWVADHGQEAYWNSTNGYPQPCNYFRKVVSVDYVNNIITIDVPTRYSMFQRDNARVLRTTGFLSEVGIEDFSIGNVENTTGGFGNDDWLVEGTTGYEVHGSYVIKMYDSYDSWIRRVYTYQPASNSTSTCHILSNGIQVDNSFQLTLEDCYFQRTEYGGGGNGCMFVLRSNDILVKNCIAEFNRHGFLISTANASGIVLFGCTDKRTERATGLSGIDGYVPGSRSSGHHLHFSHSNLLDGCTVIDSFFSFKHRMNFGTIPHGLTAAHCVVWNMKSSENEYLYTVETEQGRYGYVIGTCAECPDVNNLNPATNNTEPLDFVEGKGNGNTLTPQSLYLDQFNKRTNI